MRGIKIKVTESQTISNYSQTLPMSIYVYIYIYIYCVCVFAEDIFSGRAARLFWCFNFRRIAERSGRTAGGTIPSVPGNFINLSHNVSGRKYVFSRNALYRVAAGRLIGEKIFFRFHFPLKTDSILLERIALFPKIHFLAPVSR